MECDNRRRMGGVVLILRKAISHATQMRKVGRLLTQHCLLTLPMYVSSRNIHSVTAFPGQVQSPADTSLKPTERSRRSDAAPKCLRYHASTIGFSRVSNRS